MRLIIFILFFLSGAAGLIYEVVWLRMLSLSLGVTVYAVAAILTAFMAGLMAGSLIFGRLADKTSKPLLLYGLLEVGIGIYAAFLPLFLRLSEQIFLKLQPFFGLSRTISNYQFYTTTTLSSSLLRFLLAVLSLLLPTILMGGTLPVLSRFIVRQKEKIGFSIGLLYFINTLGAVIGTFSAGFILIGWLGISGTIKFTLAINFAVGVIAIALSLKAKDELFTDQSAKITPEEEKMPSLPYPRPMLALVLIAFFFSGLISLAYETLWTRVLYYFVGITTYSFATMLSAFLFGIAAGSILIAKFADRTKSPVALFGFLQVGLGATTALALYLLPNLFALNQTLIAFFRENNWWSETIIKFLTAFALLLPSTIFMGGTFPVVSRIYAKVFTMGSDIGKVYAVNTCGAIFGSFIASFMVIPAVGIQRGIVLFAALNLIIGLILILSDHRANPFKRGLGMALVILAGVFVVLQYQPKPIILHSPKFQLKPPFYELLYSKEGIDGTLSVLKWIKSEVRELNINGDSTAFTNYHDMLVHKMLAHLPMLLHPQANEVLVIGFGLGVTAYGCTLYQVKMVDCVELVADEWETARFFLPENHGVIANEKFRMIAGDGRNYILTTDKKYDVISFNAIHPKLSPSLYTIDFYRLCRRVLKPGGIICAWLPSTWLSVDEFRSLIRSCADNFAYTTLWWCNPAHNVLVASDQPIEIDFAHFKQRISQAEIRRDLAPYDLDDPYHFLNLLLMGADTVKELVKTAPIDADDRPIIEFSKMVRKDLNQEILRLLEAKCDPPQSLIKEPNQLSQEEDQKLKAYALAMKLIRQGENFFWQEQYPQAEEKFRQAVELLPQNRAAQRLFYMSKKEIELLTGLAGESDDPRRLDTLGNAYLTRGDYQKAMEAFKKALSLDPAFHQSRYKLGGIYLTLGKYEEAVKELEVVVKALPDRAENYMVLAQAYAGKGDTTEAIKNYELALKLKPELGFCYYQLVRIYCQQQNPELAKEWFKKGEPYLDQNLLNRIKTLECIK